MMIRSLPTSLAVSAAALFSAPLPAAEPPPPMGVSRPLFDGKTLAGWEGNPKLWRVEAGALTGGSLSETLPPNEFLEREPPVSAPASARSEEHTSELQSHLNLVCPPLLANKKRTPPAPLHI